MNSVFRKMAAVGTLEEQALQRKAKLKALRSKKSEQQSVSESLTLFLLCFYKSSIYCPPARQEGQPPEETYVSKPFFTCYVIKSLTM